MRWPDSPSSTLPPPHCTPGGRRAGPRHVTLSVTQPGAGVAAPDTASQASLQMSEHVRLGQVTMTAKVLELDFSPFPACRVGLPELLFAK